MTQSLSDDFKSAISCKISAWQNRNNKSTG
jgi:hypothetical protein